MNADVFDPYEQALASGAPLWMWREDGRGMALDIDRWRGVADDTDLDVVWRTRSPVLDVGCGPGRIVAAMTEHGRFAVGIDVCRAAVSMTRARGLNVLRRDVFDPLPGERRWRTIVVLDGSIGIGGDLAALLVRLGHLLARDGQIVIETHPDAERCESMQIRLGTRWGPAGPAFAWSTVGAAALPGVASAAGLAVVDTWCEMGRSFVVVERATSVADTSGERMSPHGAERRFVMEPGE